MKQYFYLSGKGKWCNKLFQPDSTYKCWSLMLYPNQDSYSKILELKAGKEGTQGILNVIKKDDEGYSISLKRPTEKLMKGKLMAFLPPVVLNADGSPFNSQTAIGNGSDLTCKIEYYEYKRPTGGRGSAIRLESVRIDNLVPFDKDGDFPKEQVQQASGLTDQPPPLF